MVLGSSVLVALACFLLDVLGQKGWSKCNEELVRRGEILLDFSEMDEWKHELFRIEDRARAANISQDCT